jgi:hypothetical protein
LDTKLSVLINVKVTVITKLSIVQAENVWIQVDEPPMDLFYSSGAVAPAIISSGRLH